MKERDSPEEKNGSQGDGTASMSTAGRIVTQEKTGTDEGLDPRVRITDLIAVQERAGWLNGRKGPDKMAELIALQRVAESRLPEGRRIFSDPYAIRFIDPHVLEWGQAHPEEAKALADEFEKKMPGFSNSIRARVRYFDDAVRDAAGRGFSQLVILGAGYDARAYRFDSLKGRVRVFEVDHPLTQKKKTETIAGIFGGIPGHVVFVPVDLGHDDLWDAMEWYGYSSVEQTLFVIEGLLMYLTRETVRDLFSGIANHTIDGSVILFDFLPRALADDSSNAEDVRNIRDWTTLVGEPILSGFNGEEVMPFLSEIGYDSVNVISPQSFAAMYYTGKNADRNVSGLMSFAAATVRRTGRQSP